MRGPVRDIVSILGVSLETALKVETYMSEELGFDWSEATWEETVDSTNQAYEAILIEAHRLIAEHEFAKAATTR